jgi:hypothetical protein
MSSGNSGRAVLTGETRAGMSEPVSMSKGDPAAELARARESVLALIAGSAGSATAPSLQAEAPLSRPPAATAQSIAARTAAGLTPVGHDHPRSGTWRRVVVPSTTLAVLDGIAAAVAIAKGSTILAIAAGVIFLVFAGLAISGARFASSDPLRLGASDRRALRTARRWRSRQDWSGPLAFCPERGLLVAALDAARRIARTPIWQSGQLDAHRARLDLATELDQIDAGAHAVAKSRYGGPGGTVNAAGGLPTAGPSTPSIERAWDAVVTRVAALTCYADSLDGLPARVAAALSRDTSGSGATAAEFMNDDAAALDFFLGAALFGGLGGGGGGSDGAF